MSLFENISAFFPTNGDETDRMIYQAYQKTGPAFISLKSDPQLSEAILLRP
jgi:hypothetical protein